VPWNDEFDYKTLNYAPIVFGVTIALVAAWWKISAHKWFKGPIRTIDELGLSPDDPVTAAAPASEPRPA
jgi:hypothetical protein